MEEIETNSECKIENDALVKAQNDWVTVTHLSGLVSFIGIPGIVGPLITWLVKKDEMRGVDIAGKEAINFHLTMLIVGAISAVLTMVLVGFVGLAFVWVSSIVFPIVAAVKANNGKPYLYPFTWRLIT